MPLRKVLRSYDGVNPAQVPGQAAGFVHILRIERMEVDFITLMGLFSESKRLIAQKAASFIRQNDCVYLDAATMAYHIISEIVDRTYGLGGKGGRNASERQPTRGRQDRRKLSACFLGILKNLS